jgi:hypothetical protein
VKTGHSLQRTEEQCFASASFRRDNQCLDG